MDPDAARAELCRLSFEVDQAPDAERLVALAREMADVWDGLDRWMSTGGFAPAAWRPDRE